MNNKSSNKIDELQKTLEDLGNHITVISGLLQISPNNSLPRTNQFINDSVNQLIVLIEKAISILDEIKQQ
ncbi:MAG: hypothetical protein FH758_05435 [Firmicutes bacterium]|nr:hypothetical protein [Bacillota bacterium]